MLPPESSNDFGRAIVLLSEILEEFPNTPSYPDALWLRGETYYAAHDYLAARPQDKHGVHRYSCEDFGLDPDQIRRAFEPYVIGFGVESE